MSESKTVVVASRKAYRADARVEALLYSAGIPERYFRSLSDALRNFSLQYINFGLEAFARLAQSPHISFDDSLGLIPTLVQVAGEYRATLVKQDDVLAGIANTYLTTKRRSQSHDEEQVDRIYSTASRRIASPRHSWRKHEREAKRNRRLQEEGYQLIPIGDNRLLLRVIDRREFDGKERDLNEREPLTPRLMHTNEILERVFGLTDESDKRGYLRSFNGDALYGADVVRAAYHLARFFGLKVNGDRTTDEMRTTVTAIAYTVGKYGVTNTDALLDAVGLRNVWLFKDFSPLSIGGKTSLVPTAELENIVIRLGTLPLKSPIGHSLMSDSGYSVGQIRGFPVYIN